MSTQLYSFIAIVIIALVTLATRLLPFLVFKKGREVPKAISYLGRIMPPAVIGMLVVYCFKNVNVLSGTHGLPELIASLCVVLLYVWKKNTLLSVGGGTIIYMILVQIIFK